MTTETINAADIPPDNFYIGYRSAARAAEASGTKEKHIREAVKLGFLRPRRVGLATIFLRSELEEWLNSRPAPHSRRKKRETTDAS